MSPALYQAASAMIKRAGLNPTDFCIIRNTCFLSKESGGDGFENADNKMLAKNDQKQDIPLWFIGQKFFRVSTSIAQELADWFQDPALLSEWLVSQQQRVVLEQPFAVSPFADLPQ